MNRLLSGRVSARTASALACSFACQRLHEHSPEKHARPAFMEQEVGDTMETQFGRHGGDGSTPGIKGEYDFVVVGGCGVAGNAAIQTLLQSGLVKHSDVLCVDPVGGECKGVHVAQSVCTGISVQQRSIQLGNTAQQVRYKQCLLATGKTPSSLSLTERSMSDRLGNLEAFIDPLCLPQQDVRQIANNDQHVPHTDTLQAAPAVCFIETGGQSGTTLTRSQVQMLHLQVAAGQHVTLVGDCSSDVDLLELALSLAQTAAATATATAAATSAASSLALDLKPPGQVTLLCASAGVLSQRLPRQLSQAFSRRLRTMGVEVVPYAQLRYVSATASDEGAENTSSSDGIAGGAGAGVASTPTVYCSHTFDQVQTASFETDTVVFLNADTGVQVEHFGIAKGELEGGADGGILANRSLQAAAGVYVAGEAANVALGGSGQYMPGLRGLGRGVVAGTDHAVKTAEVAAQNMLAAVKGSAGSDASSSESELQYLVYDHLPAYAWSSPVAHMHLSLIGKCSSALEAHSFFWKVSGARSSPAAVAAIAAPTALSSASNDDSDDDSSADNASSEMAESLPLPSAAEINSPSFIANADIKKHLLAYFGMKTGEEPKMNYGVKPLAVKGKQRKGRGASAATGQNNAIKTSSSSTSSGSGSSSSSNSKKDKKQKEPKEPMHVPIGLGTIIYVSDENIILGVGVFGVPPANANILHEVQRRARACVGLSLTDLTSTSIGIAGSSPLQPQQVAPAAHRQALLDSMSRVVLGPAVGVPDPEQAAARLPKPTYRRAAASSMAMREHRNHQIGMLQTPSLAVFKDTALSMGTRASVKDRLAAAFSRQMSGN